VRSIVRLAVMTAAIALGWAASASALALSPVGRFEQPIFVTSSPANPEELLVVERQGRVLRVEGAGVSIYGDLNLPFELVSCCEGERGLLSIVPAPDFASTGRFYADYTGTPAAGGAEGDIHVDSFRPSGEGDGHLIREPILSIGHAEFSNHNGGQLQLGPDGDLYISVGDGGSGGDPSGHGQNTESLLGKILRIDPQPGSEPPYSIPAGNPFAAGPGRDEIWAYGLRNPWRFSFDRLSGDMIVADVGQGEREEVDLAPSPSPGVVGGAGADYGWNCREGFSGFTDPVFDYPHSDPGGGAAHGCAIVGGYVVHNPALGELDGRYVYADLCVEKIRSLALPVSDGGSASDDRSTGLTVSQPVSFGEDSCGRVYVVSGGGEVDRLEGEAGSACPGPAAASGSPAVIAPGLAPGAQANHQAKVAIRLRAHLIRRSHLAKLVAVVTPCAGSPGGTVELRRGGHRFEDRPLNDRCVAGFHVRSVGRSTFRAVFGGQRSQVRTIAFAKPSP
jgi:hypothetical protein